MGWDSLSNSKYSHRLMYLLIFLYFTKVLLCKRTFITYPAQSTGKSVRQKFEPSRQAGTNISTNYL